MNFDQAKSRYRVYFFLGAISFIVGFYVVAINVLKYFYCSISFSRPLVVVIFEAVPFFVAFWDWTAYIMPGDILSLTRNPLFDFAAILLLVVTPISFSNGQKYYSYVKEATNRLLQERINNSIPGVNRQAIQGNHNNQAGRDINQNVGRMTIINSRDPAPEGAIKLIVGLVIAIVSAVIAQAISVKFGLAH